MKASIARALDHIDTMSAIADMMLGVRDESRRAELEHSRLVWDVATQSVWWFAHGLALTRPGAVFWFDGRHVCWTYPRLPSGHVLRARAPYGVRP